MTRREFLTTRTGLNLFDELKREESVFPCQDDISFKNPVAKYPVKTPSENLSGEYLCKISFKRITMFSRIVVCINKMSSENPLEKEIISLIKKGLQNIIGGPVNQTEMVERISESLKNTKLIPNFKIEVVQDSEEEKLVRKVLEEELDPTEIRMNVIYTPKFPLKHIKIQLPDEPSLHHKDEKP